MNNFNSRQFLMTAGAACAAAACAPLRAGAEEEASMILGHGDFKYRVVEGWGQLDPEEYPVRDCHGMVQDKQGRILLLTNHTKNNVIIYDKAGNLLETWGTKYPGAHGLSITEEDGTEFLYITDHDLHQVFKTTLDGEEVMVLDFPKETELYDSPDRYKPTDVAISPEGDFFVCDGYGQAYVIKYDNPGKLLTSFGGPRTMKTPHGACMDLRDADNPTLIVAVRGKQELQTFDLDGNLKDTIAVPGGDVCTAFVHGDEVYLPHLNGFLSILDKDNKVVSNPGGSRPRYADDGDLMRMRKTNKLFQHPHSILVDDEDNIYVPQWNSSQTYPIKLERIREGA